MDTLKLGYIMLRRIKKQESRYYPPGQPGAPRRPVVAELSLNRLDYRVSEWRGMSTLRKAHRTAAAGLTCLSTQI